MLSEWQRAVALALRNTVDSIGIDRHCIDDFKAGSNVQLACSVEDIQSGVGFITCVNAWKSSGADKVLNRYATWHDTDKGVTKLGRNVIGQREVG